MYDLEVDLVTLTKVIGTKLSNQNPRPLLCNITELQHFLSDFWNIIGVTSLWKKWPSLSLKINKDSYENPKCLSITVCEIRIFIDFLNGQREITLIKN